jgi:hypothetical protein
MGSTELVRCDLPVVNGVACVIMVPGVLVSTQPSVGLFSIFTVISSSLTTDTLKHGCGVALLFGYRWSFSHCIQPLGLYDEAAWVTGRTSYPIWVRIYTEHISFLFPAKQYHLTLCSYLRALTTAV